MDAETRLGRGSAVGHGALLMRGLAGGTGRPSGGALNRTRSPKWLTHITEHHTRVGKVYCAVVLDVYSRRVVGWPIESSPTAALVTNALAMAIHTRSPDAGAIIQSDQGVQYRS